MNSRITYSTFTRAVLTQPRTKIISRTPCNAPQCEFFTEIPSDFIQYHFGDSCDDLEDVFSLFKESECTTTGGSSYKLEAGIGKNITFSYYSTDSCSGEPEVYDMELGKCQELESDKGESVFVKLKQSAGIQTIASIILLMATALITFV